jgi:hypothetical protein
MLFPNKHGMSKDLTIEELREIILICRKEGVSELKYGSLHFVMGEKVVADKQQRVNKSKIDKIDEDTTLRDEISLREEQLAMAMIENPSAYEDLLAQNEINNGA